MALISIEDLAELDDEQLEDDITDSSQPPNEEEEERLLSHWQAVGRTHHVSVPRGRVSELTYKHTLLLWWVDKDWSAGLTWLISFYIKIVLLLYTTTIINTVEWFLNRHKFVKSYYFIYILIHCVKFVLYLSCNFGPFLCNQEYIKFFLASFNDFQLALIL